MKRIFNTSGDCKPDLHYMVNIDRKLQQIKLMIDRGDYFTINRARQYGKTTTLKALRHCLQNEYEVLSLDFQKLSYQDFQTEPYFIRALSKEILKKPFIKREENSWFVHNLEHFIDDTFKNPRMSDLFECFSRWCQESERAVVLIVDEVDSATNNQVFLDFLSLLRAYYIDRDETPAFHSVILAGVCDIKNLKAKFVADDEHKYNSPWNIASDFLVDMSFSADDIEGMLKEYESDYRTGMDTRKIAKLIYDYTSGYPFLVSRICKLVDERVAADSGNMEREAVWTKEGVLAAIRILLTEQNTLFDSLINKLEDYPELKEMLQDLLLNGREIIYVVGLRSIEIGLMFGFIAKENNHVIVANRVFETLLYNLFLVSSNMRQHRIYGEALKDKNQFISNGRLMMEKVLEKFVLHFDELYGDKHKSFLEEDGRRYFLLYLRPIINGERNYYIESRTRNMERTDVIVDYGGEQFIIELKVWRGNSYNRRGEKQLSDYLEYYHLEKGYMLNFNFNKTKTIGVKKLQVGDKILVEAVV